MAMIRPFCAIRPDPEKIERIASPPYDVVDTNQAREMAKDNPCSFLHVVRPEIDLPEGTDLHSDAVYQKAGENLRLFINKQYLVKDSEPSLFAYTQQIGDHTQTGIVACCSVDEYDSDVIKKHEKTREDKETDRTRHIMASSAQTGPVFLMHKEKQALNNLVSSLCKEKPLYSFTARDQVTHTVRRISEPSRIQELVEQFEGLENLYIADGHHRSAAASRARKEKKNSNPNHTGQEEYNFFLAVVFPASSLNILPYNRVVKDVRGLSRGDLMARIGEHFHISPVETPKPAMKGNFCIYFDKKWYQIVYKSPDYNIQDPVMNLDANLLQEYLLGPVLGIGDPRTDERISFVGGIHGAGELKRRVDSGKAEIAFLLYPVLVEDIMKVSDAGKTMPPKSTWFEPKLRSGLFVHMI